MVFPQNKGYWLNKSKTVLMRQYTDENNPIFYPDGQEVKEIRTAEDGIPRSTQFTQEPKFLRILAPKLMLMLGFPKHPRSTNSYSKFGIHSCLSAKPQSFPGHFPASTHLRPTTSSVGKVWISINLTPGTYTRLGTFCVSKILITLTLPFELHASAQAVHFYPPPSSKNNK